MKYSATLQEFLKKYPQVEKHVKKSVRKTKNKAKPKKAESVKGK